MGKRATRFAVKFNQEHKKLKKNLPFYLLFRKRRTCVHVRDWKPTDWRVEALPYIYTARRRWWWKAPIGQLAVVGCYHSYNHNYTTLFLKIYQTFPSCSFLSRVALNTNRRSCEAHYFTYFAFGCLTFSSQTMPNVQWILPFEAFLSVPFILLVPLTPLNCI